MNKLTFSDCFQVCKLDKFPESVAATAAMCFLDQAVNAAHF